ncbi:MAG: hypothetical protein Fur0037_25470 [Planctomycetota bacterium]
MLDPLRNSELFKGMDMVVQARLFAIANRQLLPKGDYLFLLGDHADHLYVLVEGKVEICFPLSLGGTVKDIAVETIEPGDTLGVSALVKPYKFTLSARAAERSELASFPRTELLKVIEGNPEIGCVFMRRLTEILGKRFLMMEALWGRELQRSLSAGKSLPSEQSA